MLIAATTVSIALFGLYASRITFIGQLGFAAVFTVVVASAGAITWPRRSGLDRPADRPVDRPAPGCRGRATTRGRSGSDSGDGWFAVCRTGRTSPLGLPGGGLTLLALLAIPLASIRLGHVDNGADPTSFTDRRAYDLIALQPSPDKAILAGSVVPTTGPQEVATGTLFQTLTTTTLPTTLRASGATGYVAGTAASQLDCQKTITSRLRR